MQLNVGDRLYHYNRYGTIIMITIDRVTEKRAFSKSYAFVREVGANGDMYPLGVSSNIYGRPRYSIETEPLKEKLRIQELRLMFYKIDASKISAEALEKILEIYRAEIDQSDKGAINENCNG